MNAGAWNGEPPCPDRPGWYWLRDRRGGLVIAARWMPAVRPSLIAQKPLRGWQLAGIQGIRPASSMAAAGWTLEGEAIPPGEMGIGGSPLDEGPSRTVPGA